MKFDLNPLHNAVQRLEEILFRFETESEDSAIRDAVVKRFEFTYELCNHFLKRYLKSVSALPSDFERFSFQDLIRQGNDRGLLLGDWRAWKHYRDLRNRTSHTYDEGQARAVIAEIPGFLEEARFLAEELRKEFR